MVFLFFHLSHFFKNYTHAVFQFSVIFFIAKKTIFNAKNENSENAESSENAENAENPRQNFDCYGVIQRYIPSVKFFRKKSQLATTPPAPVRVVCMTTTIKFDEAVFDCHSQNVSGSAQVQRRVATPWMESGCF